MFSKYHTYYEYIYKVGLFTLLLLPGAKKQKPFLSQSVTTLLSCCHIWSGAPAVRLKVLDKIQRRICNVVGPDLASRLQSLSYRRAIDLLIPCPSLHHFLHHASLLSLPLCNPLRTNGILPCLGVKCLKNKARIYHLSEIITSLIFKIRGAFQKFRDFFSRDVYDFQRSTKL